MHTKHDAVEYLQHQEELKLKLRQMSASCGRHELIVAVISEQWWTLATCGQYGLLVADVTVTDVS